VTTIIETDKMQRNITQEKHECTENCAETCKSQTEQSRSQLQIVEYRGLTETEKKEEKRGFE
jgi:hypothetical protein